MTSCFRDEPGKTNIPRIIIFKISAGKFQNCIFVMRSRLTGTIKFFKLQLLLKWRSNTKGIFRDLVLIHLRVIVMEIFFETMSHVKTDFWSTFGQTENLLLLQIRLDQTKVFVPRKTFFGQFEWIKNGPSGIYFQVSIGFWELRVPSLAHFRARICGS